MNKPWVFERVGPPPKELIELVQSLSLQIPYHQVHGTTSEWLGIKRRNKMSGEGYDPPAEQANHAYDTAKTSPAYGGGLIDPRSELHLSSLRTPTVRSVIEARIKQIEQHLQAHKDLLTELDANKQTEKLLDAMRKLGI